jgi:ferredoxin
MIDKNSCIGCGICAQFLPELFSINLEGKSVINKNFDKNSEESKEKVKECCKICPVQAIKFI